MNQTEVKALAETVANRLDHNGCDPANCIDRRLQLVSQAYMRALEAVKQRDKWIAELQEELSPGVALEGDPIDV